MHNREAEDGEKYLYSLRYLPGLQSGPCNALGSSVGSSVPKEDSDEFLEENQ
jgi:hypothetical protein